MSDFLERLRARRPELVTVETKSLGPVHMRRPTGEDRWRLISLQAEFEKQGVKRIPPAAVVAVSLVTEDGKPLFEDLDEGFKELSLADADDLQELYVHALKVTGLGKLALEAAEKKSLGSQSSDSGTTSPATSEAAP